MPALYKGGGRGRNGMGKCYQSPVQSQEVRGGQLGRQVASLRYSQEETTSSNLRQTPVRSKRRPNRYNDCETDFGLHSDHREVGNNGGVTCGRGEILGQTGDIPDTDDQVAETSDNVDEGVGQSNCEQAIGSDVVSDKVIRKKSKVFDWRQSDDNSDDDANEDRSDKVKDNIHNRVNDDQLPGLSDTDESDVEGDEEAGWYDDDDEGQTVAESECGGYGIDTQANDDIQVNSQQINEFLAQEKDQVQVEQTQGHEVQSEDAEYPSRYTQGHQEVNASQESQNQAQDGNHAQVGYGEDEENVVTVEEQLPLNNDEGVEVVQEGPSQRTDEAVDESQVPATQSERGDLRDRLFPEIPPPVNRTVSEDANGWDLIDRVGGWNAILCQFPVMEEVPRQYRVIWSWAWGEVLGKIQAADEGKELDRGLMWLLFLSQSLLRQPKRGGKSGRGMVNQRFNCLAKDKDWGKLVLLWEEDKRLADEEEARRNRSRQAAGEDKSEEHKLDLKRRQVLKLFAKGQVSRGVDRISSRGVADIRDQNVRDQLSAKYPVRAKELPDTVRKESPVPNMAGLRETLAGLEKGVSPGTGGLRPEFLTTLAEVMNDDSMNLLESFAMRYVKGELPGWFYVVFPSCQTVPLYKNDQHQLRPLGIKNPLVRSIHKEVIKYNKPELVRFLEPQQLALSTAGASKLVNSVRLMLEANPDFVAVQIDLKNAFNACSRSALVAQLEEEPTLQHLAWHAATTLAPHIGLEAGGEKWGEAGEGFAQGDPESAVWFCIAIHKFVRKLDAAIAQGGGVARCGMDDVFPVGLPHLVFPAVLEFERELKEFCGLDLQRQKCRVFSWLGVLPPGSIPGMPLAGLEINGLFEPGMLVYGVPVGTDMYVRSMMDTKIEEIAEEAVKVSQVLGEEKQALWTTLRLSTQQKLDYWLSLVHPTQMKESARRMDDVLWQMLEVAVGVHIPRKEEGLGYEHCLNIPVENLTGMSFQSWVAMLPIRLGGLGMRCQSDIAHSAYIGALEQSLPSFGGEGGVCQPLAHLVSEGENKWSALISSGTRTGMELIKSWECLQKESKQCCEFLGHEMSGQMTIPVEGMGEGNEDGSTRGKVTKEREEERAAVLKQALAGYHDPTSRPVWSWKQRDKLSTAFLLNIPGASSSLSSPIFSEAMAALLCVPSLVCRDRVGEVVGNSKVDPFGDKLVGQNLTGGGWIRRHDTIKSELNSCCLWAGLPAVCEPYSLFGQFLPQQPLSRVEYRRTRVCLRPDFLFQLPTATGQIESRIADVKTVSLGALSYYKPGAEGRRAVEIRDSQIPGQYKRTANKMDVTLGHEDSQGPVSRRLAEFGVVLGLCFGGHGEASEEVHNLINTLAVSRLNKLGMARGRPGSDQELAMVTSQLRRRISSVTVRANFTCLLERVTQVGSGARNAERRRDWVRIEEERMRKDREAQWLSRVRGVGLIQRGRFFA